MTFQDYLTLSGIVYFYYTLYGIGQVETQDFASLHKGWSNKTALQVFFLTGIFP